MQIQRCSAQRPRDDCNIQYWYYQQSHHYYISCKYVCRRFLQDSRLVSKYFLTLGYLTADKFPLPIGESLFGQTISATFFYNGLLVVFERINYYVSLVNSLNSDYICCLCVFDRVFKAFDESSSKQTIRRQHVISGLRRLHHYGSLRQPGPIRWNSLPRTSVRRKPNCR